MQKPVKLIERIIKLHTKENDTVIDCFAGSGTPEEIASLKKLADNNCKGVRRRVSCISFGHDRATRLLKLISEPVT